MAHHYITYLPGQDGGTIHYMIHFCIARAKAHKEGRFWFYISHSSAKYYMCIISREITLEYLVSSPDLIDGRLISITP